MSEGLWLNTLVTVPVVEIMLYWVSLVTVGMVAGVGWGLYITQKKKLSLNAIPFSCPFNEKKEGAPIVDQPENDKNRVISLHSHSPNIMELITRLEGMSTKTERYQGMRPGYRLW